MGVGSSRAVVMLGNVDVSSKRSMLRFGFLAVPGESAANQHIRETGDPSSPIQRFACLLGRNRESGWKKSNRADIITVERP